MNLFDPFRDAPEEIEEHFKMKGLTPFDFILNYQAKIEEHFKMKGLTPSGTSISLEF
jgi:hypothetical protein